MDETPRWKLERQLARAVAKVEQLTQERLEHECEPAHSIEDFTRFIRDNPDEILSADISDHPVCTGLWKTGHLSAGELEHVTVGDLISIIEGMIE